MERLLGSRFALNLALFLARSLPPRAGYAFAGTIARWLASRRASPLVTAIRHNQSILSGGALTPAQLDSTVQTVLANAARATYELYHFGADAARLDQLFVIEPSFQELLARPEFDRRGLVLAGVHLASFDLGLRWITNHGFKPLILTIPQQPGARHLEFELRLQSGMYLVPGSVAGVRQALRHLKQGGVVATGIDRPQPGSEPQPLFCGYPAALPTHHIFLALKAQVPLVIIVSRRQPDGKYHLHASAPLEMQPHPDHTAALKLNAERVLAVAAGYLHQSSDQWVVSQPVWSALLTNSQHPTSESQILAPHRERTA